MIGDYDYYIERSSVLGVCLYFLFHVFLFIFITFHVISIISQDYVLLKLIIHSQAKNLFSNKSSKI